MCPIKIFISSPLDTLHTPIELSQDPDAKYSPFGEKSTLATGEKAKRGTGGKTTRGT